MMIKKMQSIDSKKHMHPYQYECIWSKDLYRGNINCLYQLIKEIDSKAFIECSNDMDDIYKNIGEYNPNKKSKILIVFDDMIADMLSNKKILH